MKLSECFCVSGLRVRKLTGGQKKAAQKIGRSRIVSVSHCPLRIMPDVLCYTRGWENSNGSTVFASSVTVELFGPFEADGNCF